MHHYEDYDENGPKVFLEKKNQIAVLESNEFLTGLKLFPVSGGIEYNDVVRWLYDAMYEMNYECDFISPECERYSDYKAVVINEQIMLPKWGVAIFEEE